MSWKILINDGMEESGVNALKSLGFEVDTQKIPQEELSQKLQDYQGIIVRSATKVRQELMDVCPGLKFIARGGVGMDNIDVSYAKEKGIAVINTPMTIVGYEENLLILAESAVRTGKTADGLAQLNKLRLYFNICITDLILKLQV